MFVYTWAYRFFILFKFILVYFFQIQFVGLLSVFFSSGFKYNFSIQHDNAQLLSLKYGKIKKNIKKNYKSRLVFIFPCFKIGLKPIFSCLSKPIISCIKHENIGVISALHIYAIYKMVNHSPNFSWEVITSIYVSERDGSKRF